MGYTNHNTKNNRHGGTADHTPQASGQRLGRLGSPPAFPFRSQKPIGFSSYLRGAVIGALVAAIIAAVLGLASCNVTRTITTTAQTVQRGDTTVTIMTKTVETYDGAVDATKLLKK